MPRRLVLVRLVALAITGWLLLGAAACAASDPVPSSSSAKPGATVEAPDACLSSADAQRRTIAGTPQWVLFCPGEAGLTAPAEVPSDPLTTHLDLLSGLTESPAEVFHQDGCRRDSSRTYRVQLGYADGQVAEIKGSTDPGCVGKIGGSQTPVDGPEGLGVYGLVMSAFGQQYADSYDAAAPKSPLVCPDDPRKPDSVDVDGSSAALDTGWHLGNRSSMVMPLAAVRGLVCTWPYGQDEPVIRSLQANEAERVRIGLHVIFNAMVDCAASPEPTHTAVVEDKTGTRRAVTIVESECQTVLRSDGGFGLGFPWLDP